MSFPISIQGAKSLALLVLVASVQARTLSDSDLLDEADRREIGGHLSRALSCKDLQDFVCATRELNAAKKFANGNSDRVELKAASESVELARQLSLRKEARSKYSTERATVERNAERSSAEIADLRRKEERLQANTRSQDRDEQHALDVMSSRDAQARRDAESAKRRQIFDSAAQVLRSADKQVAGAKAESRRVLEEQAREIEQLRAARRIAADERRPALESRRLPVSIAGQDAPSPQGREEEKADAQHAASQAPAKSELAQNASEGKKTQGLAIDKDKTKTPAHERESARVAKREQEKEIADKNKKDFFTAMKNGIRLVATKCPDGAGHYYATGILPKSRPKGDFCTDVKFEASCPNSIIVSQNNAPNFIGMSGCFGDTYQIDPKPLCDVKQVKIRVIDAMPCGKG